MQLVVSEKNLGLAESLAELCPMSKRKPSSSALRGSFLPQLRDCGAGKVKEVTAMLRAAHAREDTQAVRDKAGQVAEKLKVMKRAQTTEMVATGTEETLSHYAMPLEHWR